MQPGSQDFPWPFNHFFILKIGANAADVEVTEDITADTTWATDNTYILRKPIFVTNGAVLTIEAGTLSSAEPF